MAKWAHADTLDGGPSYIKTYCDKVIVCSTQPTTYAEATSTYALADVTVDTNDFTLAAYSTTGRMCTFAAQSDVTVDASGTAAHLAFVDVSETKLLYVTTVTSQVLTAGNTVDIPETDLFQISQPS
jgi:hypothetical protein